MLEHYLVEHRRAVAAIVERHGGERRATLSFSRVSDLPDDLPDWIQGRGVRETARRRRTRGSRPYVRFVPVEFIF